MTTTQHRPTRAVRPNALGKPISGYTWGADRALAVLRIGFGLMFLEALIQAAYLDGSAGSWWADLLPMAGLFAAGMALTFGFAIRLAAVVGSVLCLLMGSLLGPVTLVVLALTHAGDTWGVGRTWARLFVVAQHPILR
jgi:hypothetical protein